MNLKDYMIVREPYYAPVANEIAAFEAAYHERLPLMLKGPTGCGKTRFVEYMAWRLKRPLITVACHEDMTSADLLGRYLLDASGTIWHDGPLTDAVRRGAICYLDEIVEARQDTVVVIHSLTDQRRQLSLEKRKELLAAHPQFFLVISYNPGYQSAAKSLKESTKQRFAALDFGYASMEEETSVIAAEAEIDRALAGSLVRLAHASRNLRGHGLDEGASTRTLIRAGRLIARGIAPQEACEMAIISPLTDDPDLQHALRSAAAACL